MQARHWAGWVLLLTAGAIWIPASDVIDLIVRQREVLLGRYSQGHFGALLFLTALLLMQGVLLLVPMKSRGDRVFASIMVPVSTGLALFLVLLVTGWMSQPRYVEKAASDETGKHQLQGLVRHRPANEYYELNWTDEPELPRSYPGRPGGYGTLPIILTSDRYGYRNPGELLESYPIVAVGDSFAAGSHVSDEQAWTVLLSNALHEPIYNLGVSGSSPRVYLNNYVVLGQRFNPKTVLFMLYEGNDFRYEAPPKMDAKTGEQQKTLGQRIEVLTKASPVTRGLRRLSSEVLQPWGADKPVPDYEEKMGWMPVRLATPMGDQYYSFPPKRLKYLNVTAEQFAQSPDWTSVRDVLLEMKALTEESGARLVIVYAPSTPHVVLPLVESSVPADQLHRFMLYETDRVPAADTLKAEVFARLDNQESVVRDFCREQGLAFVSTTVPLRDAMQRGEQVYYSYDQHWTPQGNAVVASVLEQFLTAP
ncbi:MAG TPA: SGNH/GDSL hydrolase family protein [Pseudomonadales bacterium]|jgi:hypothetical protein